MNHKKIILVVLIASLIFYLLIFTLLSGNLLESDILFSNLFLVIVPLITGISISLLFIIGYFYLIKSSKLKEQYKTLPLYGIAVILEAISDIVGQRYEIVFFIVASLFLGIVIVIDIRKKIGMYLLFKNIFLKRS